MSRFALGGLGGPIPTVALPDPNLDENLAPQAFLLEDGVPFIKTDWENLGYTHYEVWCIGGAGGRGAGVGDLRFLWSTSRPRMSDADWELYIELMVIYASMLTPPYGPYFPQSPAGVRAYHEANSPNHDPYFVRTYHDPWLVPNPSAMGGGGGGGGLHVTAGLLEDLPTLSPVVVGAAGVDAPPGQNQESGTWVPDIEDASPTPFWHPPPALTRRQVLDNYFNNYQNKYPLPHPSFEVPQPGGDGGYSSFNDDTCRASGGKGGRPGLVWSGSAWVKDGSGGDGGCGDRTVAGGGAAGSIALGVAGSEGTWDGTIGKGGGGGHAGGETTGSTGIPPHPTTITVNASAGGKGSFNFGDTTVYGPGQTRQQFMQPTYTTDPTGGVIVAETLTPTGKNVVGGIGGGAHRNDLKYGSLAPGYLPQGMVLIRIYKLE